MNGAEDSRKAAEPHLKRITEIAYEHMLYAERHPERLAELAARLSISQQQAVAVAIADQVCEEFTLTPK